MLSIQNTSTAQNKVILVRSLVEHQPVGTCCFMCRFPGLPEIRALRTYVLNASWFRRFS